jgi:hypothetical protein
MNKRIILPRHLSLDGAAAAWLYCRAFDVPEDNICYESNNWSGEDMSDDDVSIGLQAKDAVKGEQIRYGPEEIKITDKETGRKKSIYVTRGCFSRVINIIKEVSENPKLDKDLADTLNGFSSMAHLGNYLNSTLTEDGPWANNSRKTHFLPHMVDLLCVFESLKNLYESESDADESLSSIQQVTFEILDGMLFRMTTTKRAKKACESIVPIEHNGFIIAVAEGSKSLASKHIVKRLFRENIDIIVYSQGNDIGIIRNKDLYELNVSELKPQIDEEDWLFSQSGTMASRGTATSPSKDASKYSPADLIEIIKSYISNSGIKKGASQGVAI